MAVAFDRLNELLSSDYAMCLELHRNTGSPGYSLRVTDLDGCKIEVSECHMDGYALVYRTAGRSMKHVALSADQIVDMVLKYHSE